MFSLNNLLFWIVFPFLIPQALYIRQTAPRFAPAGGASVGSVGGSGQTRLLAIGDSIIAGVGVSEFSKALVGQTAMALATFQNSRVEWEALGVSGYDSTRVLEHLVPKLPGVAYDYIIVSVGVNDVTGLTSIRKWRRSLGLLLAELETHSPQAMIAVIGMPPLHYFPLLPQPLRATLGLRGKSFGAVAKKVVNRRQNSRYVPLDIEPDPTKFAPDGYHPSEESYAEFGRHMANVLVAMKSMSQVS